MANKLIGREKECIELKRCFNSDRSEFVIVYGRRRAIVNEREGNLPKDAFEIVDKVLLDWQRAFFPQIEFQSLDTGEIFQIEELSRVRGILDLLGSDTVFVRK